MDHLEALEEKGYITRPKNQARAIQITKATMTTALDLLERVALGDAAPETMSEIRALLAVCGRKVPANSLPMTSVP